MFAAASFDEKEWDGSRSGAWTVVGRLRDRQRVHRQEAAAARKRQADEAGLMHMMTAALMQRQYEDALKAQWRGGPSVLAFLFAQPDSPAIASLDRRGDYLNIRSGNEWDLFFPGYYRSDKPDLESQLGSQSVGERFAADWYFNPTAFDLMRRHVEGESCWRYSGEMDLVLINAWVPERGDPSIDWDSAQSWQLAAEFKQGEGMSLSSVVERISSDLERDEGHEAYGVTSAPPGQVRAGDSTATQVAKGTLAGIATALARRGLGLG